MKILKKILYALAVLIAVFLASLMVVYGAVLSAAETTIKAGFHALEKPKITHGIGPVEK